MKIFNQSFATGPKAKWWFYNTLTLKWMPVNQLGFFGIGIDLHLHFCQTLSLKFPNTFVSNLYWISEDLSHIEEHLILTEHLYFQKLNNSR